jgi:hypothetical protein
MGLSEADARAMLDANQPVSWEPIENLYLDAHPSHPANIKSSKRRGLMLLLLIIAVVIYNYFS